MTPQDTTKFVLIVTAILLSLFDAYMIWTYGMRASLSEVLVAQSRENPVIVLAFGLVCGHLFWRI